MFRLCSFCCCGLCVLKPVLSVDFQQLIFCSKFLYQLLVHPSHCTYLSADIRRESQTTADANNTVDDMVVEDGVDVAPAVSVTTSDVDDVSISDRSYSPALSQRSDSRPPGSGVLGGWFRLTTVSVHDIGLTGSWQPALPPHTSPWLSPFRRLLYWAHREWAYFLLIGSTLGSFFAFVELVATANSPGEWVGMTVLLILFVALLAGCLCLGAVTISRTLLRQVVLTFDFGVMLSAQLLSAVCHVVMWSFNHDHNAGPHGARLALVSLCYALAQPGILLLCTVTDTAPVVTQRGRLIAISLLFLLFVGTLLSNAYVQQQDGALCVAGTHLCQTWRGLTNVAVLQLCLFSGKFLYHQARRPDYMVILSAPVEVVKQSPSREERGSSYAGTTEMVALPPSEDTA